MNTPLQAIAYYRQGQLDAALASCREALLSPTPPLAAFEIASEILLRQGRWQEAESLLERALRLAPSSLFCRFNLGAAKAQQGYLPEALEQFNRCLDAEPENPDYLNAVGNSLRLQGSKAEALEMLERACSVAPRHPGVRENLGWLAVNSSPKLALAHFEAAFAAGNRSTSVARGMVESLLGLNAAEKAEQLARSALQQFPGDAELMNCLAIARVRQHKSNDAVAAFRSALRYAPDHCMARVNLAVQLEQLGELQEAEEQLRKVLQHHPHSSDALFHLTFLKSTVLSAEDECRIHQALQQANDEQERIRLHFALGRLYEQQKQPHKSIREVLTARQLLAPSSRYCPEADCRHTDLMIRCHPLHEQRIGAPGEPPKIIFVVGMPRSGTSLVEQILASHPDIEALGESGAVGKVLGRFREGDSTESQLEFHALGAAAKENMRNQLVQSLQAKTVTGGKKVIVETTPGNHQFLGMLAELLPTARFVLCQRSPLDTAVSLLQHPLSREHDYAHCFEHLEQRLNNFTRLQRHWQRCYPGQCIPLLYEDLVRDAKGTIREMLDALTLPFAEPCLSPHQTRRPVRTPSAAQVRRPINSQGLGRWQQYQDALAPLIKALEGVEREHRARLRTAAE
ncbi:hypothetical protein AWR36_002030 [Microbulbifer flavimaris]|uniref:Tetratricopeptide repeat protein n=1 Tax=Microbulbifer flavimaris TaxID=1781068 RepID=A0ABX4I2E3_9GAMM|nr:MULTISPECIES: tetratricopeptide repeat-containing sulfotransferase family protein [Microbulbifer]KUJ84498.1 hypothetical protein AVO43_02030 [Microbulbifer sp. ZGT114]PCO06585.1 hypothetical protein AWR36_002030 [Microbulbifer flavimaris]